MDLPSATRVVILGGGIAGLSTAYHLSLLGIRDVLVLEQNRIGGGTTWHAAGMVTRLRVSSSMMRINQTSADLYARLESETGIPVGWRQVGSLVLARTSERLAQFARTTAMAAHLGVESSRLSPSEVLRHCPILRVDDLLGGYWIPHDGRVDPIRVVEALAHAARSRGVRILEHCRVTRLLHSARRVHGVEVQAHPSSPDRVAIAAEQVVLAGGMWSRQWALDAGVDVPLQAVEHHYVVSRPLSGAHGGLPCVRDMDGSIYFRGEDLPDGQGAVVLGAFQKATTVWKQNPVPPDFSFQLLQDDWPKFADPQAEGEFRIPGLKAAGYEKFVNGPESFTPDNQWLMGETPGLRGLFVLCGFNSAGIASSGGAGKALAEWMLQGEMPFDLTSVDIRRFGAWANRTEFLHARVGEALGLHYQMAWPDREFTSGRHQRCSALHARLARAGAIFGVKGGWERPNYFRTPEDAPTTLEGTFGRPVWFEAQAREHRAARTSVVLFDLSSFGKIDIAGPNALALLERICCSRVDVPIGRIVYTGMLNRRGGYESDVTLLRLGADHFRIITGSALAVRDADWIDRHAQPGESFTLRDLSDAWGVIGVMGPNAATLLTATLHPTFSDPGWTWGEFRGIRSGNLRFIAARMSYVGESGWELHCERDDLEALYQAIESRLAESQGRLAGYHAILSLRIECGFRAWGAELSPDESPLDAGLPFQIDWTKPFIGRDALEAQRTTGPRKRCVSLVADDPNTVWWGAEPIWRDGKRVGATTSATFGHTIGAPIALGYVRTESGQDPLSLETGRYEVQGADGLVPARVSFRPLIPPKRNRPSI